MDRPHHIAIFLPSLRGGGAERVMVTLANGFAARGHRVDLVLARAEGPYLAEVAPNVRIVDLDRGRVLASLLPLAQYLRRERPDAMLSALNHANIIAVWARMLARVPVRLVVSERNSLTHFTGFRARMFLGLMRRAYHRADAVVSVTQAGAQQVIEMLGLPATKVTAIPNPVDVDQITQLAAERPDHHWLTPGQPPVVLAVGRLAEQKDYPTLLQAFAMLRKTTEAKLIILGEGHLRADLETRIDTLGLADDVDLVGFKPNPFGWMAACDVYVLSSRHEGFPNSLVQAMACGAKVVSTDCPTGPDEILENGKWGRLVRVGDPYALADALGNALREGSHHNIKERVKEFRMDRAIENYLALLRIDRKMVSS